MKMMIIVITLKMLIIMQNLIMLSMLMSTLMTMMKNHIIVAIKKMKVLTSSNTKYKPNVFFKYIISLFLHVCLTILCPSMWVSTIFYNWIQVPNQFNSLQNEKGSSSQPQDQTCDYQNLFFQLCREHIGASTTTFKTIVSAHATCALANCYETAIESNFMIYKWDQGDEEKEQHQCRGRDP